MLYSQSVSWPGDITNKMMGRGEEREGRGWAYSRVGVVVSLSAMPSNLSRFQKSLWVFNSSSYISATSNSHLTFCKSSTVLTLFMEKCKIWLHLSSQGIFCHENVKNFLLKMLQITQKKHLLEIPSICNTFERGKLL